MGIVPPLVGVAVNVTLVSEHIAPDGTAAMLTLGVRFAFTVMFILLEVAVTGIEQAALEVITQVMLFPFTRVVLV